MGVDSGLAIHAPKTGGGMCFVRCPQVEVKSKGIDVLQSRPPLCDRCNLVTTVCCGTICPHRREQLNHAKAIIFPQMLPGLIPSLAGRGVHAIVAGQHGDNHATGHGGVRAKSGVARAP